MNQTGDCQNENCGDERRRKKINWLGRTKLSNQRQRQQYRRPEDACLNKQMRGQQWILPKIARLGLREKIRRVDCRQSGQRNSRSQQPALYRSRTSYASDKVQSQNERITCDDERAFHEPTLPLRSRENHVEARRVFKIPNQQKSGKSEKRAGNNRRYPQPQ